MIKIIQYSLTFVFSLMTLPSWGYSDIGHKAVAKLAWDQLSPYARQNVERILGAGEKAFVEASVWADHIKRDDRFNHLKPLHYVNLPKGAKAYNAKRDCKKNQCVVEAIHDFSRISVNGSEKEQILALRMLIHLLGDIHQPLHAGLAEDRGGNWFEVVHQEKTLNLHKLWDTVLVKRIGDDGFKVAHQLQGSAPKAEIGLPEQWASESHQIAMQVAYATKENRPLSESYLSKGEAVTRQRLQLAGWRLAMWLNKLW